MGENISTRSKSALLLESYFRRLTFAAGATLALSLVALLSFEFLCAAAFTAARWLHQDPLRPDVSPAYMGAAWVSDLYREQAARLAEPYVYVPFTVTGVTPWHGKYFNNDEHTSGVWRRTDNPDRGKCSKPEVVVWIFGGSTIYGTGVSDGATIPSYLSRNLNNDWHTCVEVTNFGSESFVTNQEVMLLQEQLKRGGKPNIVIFYDGFNDSHIGMGASDPAATHYGVEIVKARVEGTLRGRFDFVRQFYSVRLLTAMRQLFMRKRSSPGDEETIASANRVLDNYEGNHQLARALGEAYGFKFYGFWQPMLFFGDKSLDSFEKQIQQLDNSSRRRFDPRPVAAAYKEAERRAPTARFTFLAAIFDSLSQPIYIDEAHLGPKGNELIAAAIAKDVEDHSEGKLQSSKRSSELPPSP